MNSIVVILLVIATIKFVVFGGILYAVFRPDLKKLQEEAAAVPQDPTCMYCQSVYTRAIDEGQKRWDKGDLVLVTTYECQHCGLPFWHVERIKTSTISA